MANSKDFAWKDISIVVLGKTIRGIQSIEYKETVEKNALYGRGQEPLAIQSGNKSYEGSMELLRSEYDLMVVAAKAANPLYSVTDIAFDIIVCYTTPNQPNNIKTDVIVSAEITEASHSISQGDMQTVVTLPFMYLRQYSK